MFEMMPTSFFSSSTTGRFLRPYLNRIRVASSVDMDGMAQSVPLFMTERIFALGLSMCLRSSLAVTNPRRYPFSVMGKPWKLELMISCLTCSTVISGLTVWTFRTMYSPTVASGIVPPNQLLQYERSDGQACQIGCITFYPRTDQSKPQAWDLPLNNCTG